MIINNISVILQFIKQENNDKRQKDIYKLYLKLDKTINNSLTTSSNSYKLFETELYENDSFKESCQKTLRRNSLSDDFKYIKSNHYDAVKTSLDERIIQCSNICILNTKQDIDDSWFEVLLDTNKLILKNNIETIEINYIVKDFETRITSANVLLAKNHTIILIEALNQLKTLFYYTDVVFDYLNKEFTISDINSILNVFSQKPFSKSTTKRRFNRFIEKTGNTDDKEEIQANTTIFYKRKQI